MQSALHCFNMYKTTFSICDPPRENREKGDDTGTLVWHAKQRKISLTRKQRVITHGSLKFSIVINNTVKTEERVHSNKGACQDKKKKPASKMTRWTEQNDTLSDLK